MESPTASGEYFSDSCGDLYTFFLKVGPGDVIEDVSYFTTGCGFGTATCSLLVELVRGKTVDEALAITDADIEAARGIAAAAAAKSGNGQTSQDLNVGPKVVDDGGMVTIKLH